MKNFDSRVYSISDIIEWRDNNLLELSPDFQRRSVWSRNAKSYLIDTIIRGKPMPKILISQRLSGSRTYRIVVDGQQRLRAIYEFIDGDFKISRAHNKMFANYSYDMLPDEIQNEFLKYELGIDVLFDMSYEDILDIFARINTYTVTLNTQEKRNAKYVGFFKQFVYDFGYKYINYFLEGKVITKHSAVRMAEAELSAELLVSLIDGVQTNKNTENFYKKYEEDIGDLESVGKKFDEIMDYIGAIYPPEELSQTNWSRVHLFYSLFCAIGHCLYRLNGLDPKLRVKLTASRVGKFRVTMDDISYRFDLITKSDESSVFPEEYIKFIDYSRRRTTDTAARVFRANFICGELKNSINNDA